MIPDGIPKPMDKDSLVRHRKWGIGKVVADNGMTVVVKFPDHIEECEKEQLERIVSPSQRLDGATWDTPLELVTRVQAEAILSTNDAWGVFSCSQIELYPHQLWVCRQVAESWPARWLVADDVGLGKTIEAGIILLPLIERQTVRRLLILCPASLVEQWQYRMRTMFDIRLAQYVPEADTRGADFWGVHPYVIASLQTLRLDNKDRHQRLLEADPWDMLIVDEAHHLNAEEKSAFGQSGGEVEYTLGYRLVRKLVESQRVQSMLFFTGTPHRGKNVGFLSLVQLLRPDLFDNRKPIRPQLSSLPQVMIRNNKYNVTDLKGAKLFQAPLVNEETYSFSPAEERFYRMLTEFILSGQAYASTLSQSQARTVGLVLIALQKLASSSVAAIRRALRRRLDRVHADKEAMQKAQEIIEQLKAREDSLPDDEDAKLEEQLAAAATQVKLMENEESRLKELLQAAEQVGEETKIRKLMQALRTRFPERSVLFFTEYKATQSLLMSALMAEYGRESCTFINGDSQADEVRLPDGKVVSLSEPRESAAHGFNTGRARFLVSTEAGGEGIDLQGKCFTLVHVDLPWNPMRLHQRVGRLNRIGQQKRVEVLLVRNPDTVESMIWAKLFTKLGSITQALGMVMEEPEDMLQLVLGMTRPSLFQELFSEAHRVPKESVSKWFDERTSTFGGQDVLETVRAVVGNASKFNFQKVSARLPQVDLPDLRPFLEGSLALGGRKLIEEQDGLRFSTPDSWRKVIGVQHEYRRALLSRSSRDPDAQKRLFGVGQVAMKAALEEATSRSAACASIPKTVLSDCLYVFRIRDRVTGQVGASRGTVLGVSVGAGSPEPRVLLDWQLLLKLNELGPRKAFMTEPSSPSPNVEAVKHGLRQAEQVVTEKMTTLELPYRRPEFELIAVFCPRENTPL